MKRKAAIKNIGSYLQDARYNMHISQKEMGDHFGFKTPQFVSNIERGICLPPAWTHAHFVEKYKLDPQVFAEKILHVEKVRLMESIQGAAL